MFKFPLTAWCYDEWVKVLGEDFMSTYYYRYSEVKY